MGTKAPDLGIFKLEFENNIVKFEISTHWICLIAEHREIMKMPKFRTKNAFFRYFWAWILKNYCHIWNQRPRICPKWVFKSYSEFWRRQFLKKVAELWFVLFVTKEAIQRHFRGKLVKIFRRYAFSTLLGGLLLRMDCKMKKAGSYFSKNVPSQILRWRVMQK